MAVFSKSAAKPIHKQVIFVTGATSGIGLAVVKMAVDQGAKVFMLARNEEELQSIQDKMRLQHFETAYAVADVAEIDQVQAAADKCIATFGGVDTWINNAGTTLYGRLLDTTVEEARKVFDTNFWGVVNGCKVAVPLIQSSGGTIINVGSSLSDASLPLQGIHHASKSALKVYTESLRRELMSDKLPIEVSLVLPPSVDTHYMLHARSHLGEPSFSAPVYSPELVATKILQCAVDPVREISVGSSAVFYTWLRKILPWPEDKSAAKKIEKAPMDNQAQSGNLFSATSSEGEIHGYYPGHVRKSSVITEFLARPKWPTIAAFLGGTALMVFKKRRSA